MPSNSSVILSYFQLLQKYSLHSNAASESQLLRNCAPTYQTTKNVSITSLLSNANNKFKRSSMASTSDTQCSSSQCGVYENSTNPYNTDKGKVYCTVNCNDNSQSIYVGGSSDSSNSRKTVAYKLGFAQSTNEPIPMTYYLYYKSNNADESSNANNGACYAKNNIYALTFTGCIILNNAEQSNIPTVNDILVHLMAWYWGFKNPCGLYASCTYPSGTYTNYQLDTSILNAFITVEFGTTGDNCYYKPQVRRVCSSASSGFYFPGMYIGGNNDIEGQPAQSASPNYQCANCCNDLVSNGACPSASSSDNCKCVGMISYYMYHQSKYNNSGSCWYHKYYKIHLENVVVGWGSNSSINKNIKKWLFWFNGLNGNKLNIENFALQVGAPSNGTQVSKHSISGTGINDIDKDNNSGYYVVEISTYFDIGYTSSGATTTPLIAVSSNNGSCPTDSS